MRTILSLILVFFLASCPILCGTASASLGVPCGHQGSSHDETAPHPVNDDCCVCNGALKIDAVGLDAIGVHLDALSLVAFLPAPIETYLNAAPSPSPRDARFGMSPPGDPARACALLQTFRC